MRSPSTWALALLCLHATAAHGSRPASDAAATQVDVCESRTINYITHTLPQQCLRTSWTSPDSTAASATDGQATASSTVTATASSPSPEPTQEGSGAQHGADEEDLAASSFMSFEEWKEMMLRKSGQDPANIRAHRQREHRPDRDPSVASGDGDSFGEDGEIPLDFDALAEKVSELTSSSSGQTAPHAAPEAKEEQIFYDDGKTQYYRSKDAGKTCKERFSYSSFDAGATVLKTSPGAKNAKAILVENKDSYMLLECRTKNKFVIVELSDDILVDTVVLANFEFFSSMIRKFRVSASDRYPVKMDKWVDLGTFEARNSRDIQAFLIEHPQIYTKYIRIEFLSHYGNEFYCPVSLLRVHGTRMLDTWKEPSHDDEPEQIEGAVEQPPAKTQQVEEPPAGNNSSVNATDENNPVVSAETETGLSPWLPVFHHDFSLETCALRSPTTAEPTPVSPNAEKPAGDEDTVVPRPSAATAPDDASHPSSVPAAPESPTARGQSASSSSSGTSSSSSTAGANSTASNAGNKQATDSADTHPPPSTPTTSRNKTSGASTPPSASPTVQESFFKTVTKRLQLLESNTSLSLQYIEEQSRFLQDVLLKMERKQITRVDAFLDNLNKTVLSELRNVRTQYDQIWQSTVIALETQREQSQREIVALTSRLNVLADEVVFQKRMAILQSVLLLSCLVLVIFSRGGFAQALDPSSFPLPPTSYSSYYRRHAHPHSRGDSLSGMSAPASPPPHHQTSGVFDTDPGPTMNFSPSPPSASRATRTPASASAIARNNNTNNAPTSVPISSFSSSSSPTLAASALPRHPSHPHALKSLPMTPEHSREPTPAVHNQQHRNHNPDDSSPGASSLASSSIEIVESADAVAASPGTDGDSSRPTPRISKRAEEKEKGDERHEGREEEQDKALRQERGKQPPPPSRPRSTLSQLKPLPALPEDPS